MPRRDLIFRVFVSSTFGDLIAERNVLQEKAFPALRKYCQEHGARFQAIDLRWGVSQEAALDQQTMRICLEELRRCQNLSPRPNFIVLLGNRYGWRPLPAEIEAREFEELLAQVPDADKTLLATDGPVPAWRDGQRVARVGWYRKDLNAVPAMYLLQPRTVEFPPDASDDDRKRIRQEEARDWAALERRMREAFISAMAAFGWSADDPRRFKYEASATHQEIRAGALEVQDRQDHVYCYFREIDGLAADQTAALYRDIRDDTADADAESRLLTLKAHLDGILPPDHVHKYRASWRAGQPEYDLRYLCDDVERDLKGIIDREVASFKRKPALEHEREAHREFAEERCRHFVGRRDVLERIRDYLADPQANRPLVIHGVSGCGKTALMAKAVLDLTESVVGNSQVTIVSRFIGATPGSSDLRTLLGDLCRELGVADIPQDMNELVRAFRNQLSTEQSGGVQEEAKQPPADRTSVVLFLDGLDQLNSTDNAGMLYWIPREVKSNVKLVVSILQAQHEGGNCPTPDDPLDRAREIWPGSLVEVGTLDETTAEALVEAWLGEAGRTLQNGQRKGVVGKFTACPLPLYLKLVFAEARGWRSWEGVPAPLSDTMEGILEQMLATLERKENHGRTMVSRSLGYLAAARHGIAEDELIDVLSSDSDTMRDFLTRAPTELAKPESGRLSQLPLIVWSRLHADLGSYLTTRSADGTRVLCFYHRVMAEAAEHRYLPGQAVRPLRNALATFFASQPWQSSATDGKMVPNHRKLSEYPWLLQQNRRWLDLKRCLTDLDAFQLLDGTDRPELLGYWAAIGNRFDLAAEYLRRLDHLRGRSTQGSLSSSDVSSGGRCVGATGAPVDSARPTEPSPDLLKQLGAFLLAAGRSQAAEEVLSHLSDRLETLGESPGEDGATLSMAATICRRTGRFGEARQLYERAAQVYADSLGPDHEYVGTVFYNLGVLLCCDLAQYREAEDYAIRALRIRQLSCGEKHPDVAQTLNLLGMVRDRLGRWSEAEGYHRQALEIRSASLPPGHPDIAESLHNLAVVRANQASPDEAAELLQRAIQIRRDALPSAHPNLAASLFNLAALHWRQGDLQQAETLCREAHTILQDRCGANHPETVAARDLLERISRRERPR